MPRLRGKQSARGLSCGVLLLCTWAAVGTGIWEVQQAKIGASWPTKGKAWDVELRDTVIALSSHLSEESTLAAARIAVTNSTILLTASNAYHFDLVILQHKTLKNRGLANLQKRLIVVCLDTTCMKLCSKHKVRNCVQHTAAGQMGPSDFIKGDYYKVIFTKWLLMKVVLNTGFDVLWIDDDQLLLKDPFNSLSIRSGSVGSEGLVAKKCDFRYQTERGDGDAAPPNGGLLYVRSTREGRALVDGMTAQYGLLVERASPLVLDQDVILTTAAAANVTGCALPKRLFAGHCIGAHVSDGSVLDVVSYHAHCCATAKGKLALMERFLLAVERAELAEWEGARAGYAGSGAGRRLRGGGARAHGPLTVAAADETFLDVGPSADWLVGRLWNSFGSFLRRASGRRQRSYSELDERMCFSEELSMELRRLNAMRPLE